MATSDEHNLVWAEGQARVDQINAEFYATFPYPWSPMRFERVSDRALYRQMLHQDLGDWEGRTLPAQGGRIWVAGCGTNQAVITALRFPDATIVGSDLSSTSLELAARNARDLGIENLELRQESINDVAYADEFDLILCTGVIHHNADPALPLARLARALRPTGVLELMVYNRFHSVLNTAFQKAIRILGGEGSTPDFRRDLAVARGVVASLPPGSLMEVFTRRFKMTSESDLADMLIQPVWRSYTVESLGELCAGCGVELVTPCMNAFDASRGVGWNLELTDPEAARSYGALSDRRRWQVINLLLAEQSPMLWFYVQRTDSPRQIKDEARLCEEFLDRRFVRIDAERSIHARDSAGRYAAERSTHGPWPVPPDPVARKVVEAADGRETMRAIVDRLEIPGSRVNALRVGTASAGLPHLRAVSA